METAAVLERTGATGRASDLLEALAYGHVISAPVAVVAAHPDDETISLGSRLRRLPALDLIHLTPGAPADDGDARRAGFPDGAAYAAARAAELEAALQALHATPLRRLQLGHVDGATVFALARLVGELEARLDGAAAVIVHPYEGGHPDHDTAAAAVQLACARFARRGRPAPVRLEYASYHLGDHGQASGVFWPDPSSPAHPAALTEEEVGMKRAAFAAHASQQEVLRWFDPAREAFRQAPRYDFAAPPPPSRALYDGWGWALTSEGWRTAVAPVLAAETGGA